MKIDIAESQDTILSFSFNPMWGQVITLTLTGDCYFTNSTGTSNLGKTVTKTGDSSAATYYVSKGSGALIISDKYKLLTLEFLSGVSRVSLYLEDLSATPFWSVGLNGTKAKGSIENIKPTAQYVQLMGLNKAYGNVAKCIASNVISFQPANSPHLTLDISAFENHTSLNTLNIASMPNCTGNLSSLAGCTALAYLNVANTGVTGDTSSLSGLTNLTTFFYTGTAITGSWPLV
jgi:hypothetical protein